MRAITFLELIFWFIRFFSRICFKFKGSENLEPKIDGKEKGKKFFTPVVKKQKKNKKVVLKVSQKKIGARKK